MPSVVKMVHRGLQESGSMRINQADLNEFEVDHGDDTFVVNLETQTCGCYRWTLMGIPCWHALACIQLKSRCGGLGHYKTKCNNPVQQVVPKPKGRKQVGVGQRRRKSVARKGGSQKKKRSTSANQVHISICHGDAPPLTQSQDPPAMGS
uniref:SWIM-type domain-containing protein n=1 Tax=Chenopodium quinoa TaxID=63459 RepID=A0A803MJ65_CHEQI